MIKFADRLADTHKAVRTELEMVAESMRSSTNWRWRAQDLVVGDDCWLHMGNLCMPAKVSHKLSPKFVGPFKVIE